MGYVQVQPPKDYAELSPAQRLAFWREAVLDALADQVSDKASVPTAGLRVSTGPDPDVSRSPVLA